MKADEELWDGKEIDWISTWKMRIKGVKCIVVINEKGEKEVIQF
jgi:hypothetical protein